MRQPRGVRTSRRLMAVVATVAVVASIAIAGTKLYPPLATRLSGQNATSSAPSRLGTKEFPFAQRVMVEDISGFASLGGAFAGWKAGATLEEIAQVWQGAGRRALADLDRQLGKSDLALKDRIPLFLKKASFLNSEAEPEKAYATLQELRRLLDEDPIYGPLILGTTIYYQGVTALRRGETDNCVMCRGESSCILPIVPAAVHTNPLGSRLAIKHFREYLDIYPDDLDVRWLLNVAHMTLGEYPHRVEPSVSI